MDKKHIRLSIIGFAVLLIGLVGVSFSFFNYTRTGAMNNLGTGRIYFNASQGTALNITNVFPMTSTEAANASLDSITIGILGDTTYTDGEEYQISIVDVTNTVNGKEIPMNYIATYAATSGNVIGTSSNDYWNAREDKDANIYKLNASGKVEEGEQVLVGYIDNGATGINGNLTISAYIDADRIAISDTYYENATTTPAPTAPNDEYGTTTEWADGRTVLTTSEWNSLGSTPISFKIRAESNEGIWAYPVVKSCVGCKFLYVPYTAFYTTWNLAGTDGTNPIPVTPTVFTEGLYDNYLDVINASGENHFHGVKLNSNNEATNAYACGIRNNVPFCIEGTLSSDLGGTRSAEVYESNKKVLTQPDLYGDTCIEQLITATDGYDVLNCRPASGIGADSYTTGDIWVFDGPGGPFCNVGADGGFECGEY